VEVRYIGVRMWTLGPSGVVGKAKPIPKQGKMRYAPRRFIQFNGFEPGLPLNSAKSLLQSAGLAYTENRIEYGDETIIELNLPPKICMKFFVDDHPWLGAVYSRSKHEGA
jgi:hypothetical protein